jgi:hypothetical protein
MTAPVGVPEVERGIEFVGDDAEPKGVVVAFTANWPFGAWMDNVNVVVDPPGSDAAIVQEKI